MHHVAVRMLTIACDGGIGAPLCEGDLIPNEELGHEIKRWILLRSTGLSNETAPAAADGSSIHYPSQRVDGSAAANDDLYDF
jgi:hypothetical protein